MTASSYTYDDLLPLMRRAVDPLYGPEDSTLDVIWTLYDRILDVTPGTADDIARDRFYLSKGHNAHAFYAVLTAKGFIPEEWMDTAFGPDSRLGTHPDRTLVPGAEISAGSLGHGLPLAVGTALGLRAQGVDSHIYVLVGDAELDEGSNHEAIAYAGATSLGALTVIVLDNDSASHGWPGGIASRFTAHGWTGTDVDGRDHDAIEKAVRAHDGRHPHVVIAHATSRI